MTKLGATLEERSLGGWQDSLLGTKTGDFSMAAGIVSIVISLPPEPGTAGYISWGKRSEPER